MSGLTFAALNIKEADVKILLDQPVQKFLKSTTIIELQQRAFNLIDFQINIDIANKAVVTNAVNAIAAWHSFGAYGQSISNTLQLQDISAYRANLEHYKGIAMMYTALIGVDLEKESNPVFDDSIPVVAFGFSALDK